MISSLSSINPYSNMSSVDYQSNPFALLNSSSIFEDFMNSTLSQYMSGSATNPYLAQLLAQSQTQAQPQQTQVSYQTSSYNVRTSLPSVQESYNAGVAEKLARTAERTAKAQNTKGWCARGVNDSFQAANITNGETRVPAAYMSADVLAKHPNFKEISVKRSDLKKLPAGCVICWDKTNTNSLAGKYGHIAITLGDGREASDNVSDLKILNSEYRVFVPVSTNGVTA